MKKYFVIAAAAALTLASCAKVETYTVKNNEENPISFGSYTPRALSKASTGYFVDGETHTNLVDATTFGVYAWSVAQTSTTPWTDGAFFAGSGAPDFMNNIPVTYKGDTAGSSGANNMSSTGYYSEGNPVRYWPSGDTPDGLSFYAYYPVYAVGKGLTMPANGLGATNFTVNTDVAQQLDFMVAPVVADQWYGHTNGTGDGTVDLTFKHTLTKVRFFFKTDCTDPSTTVKLAKAQLVDVYKTNTLTTAYTSDALWTKLAPGTFSYNWGTAEDEADFDVKIDGATPTDVAPVTLTTTATNCALGDNFLMVPQTIADNGQKITLKWTVTTAGVTTTNTKTIDLYDIKDSSSNVIQWSKNLQVAYTIVIGPKAIYFTAATTGWDTEKTGTISVN